MIKKIDNKEEKEKICTEVVEDNWFEVVEHGTVWYTACVIWNDV